MDENVNLRLERDVNRAICYCLLYIVSYLAATAMLKMDENVNLRLQRHVNRALFCCLRLFSWHRFVNFSKYWVANDRERKR